MVLKIVVFRRNLGKELLANSRLLSYAETKNKNKQNKKIYKITYIIYTYL